MAHTPVRLRLAPVVLAWIALSVVTYAAGPYAAARKAGGGGPLPEERLGCDGDCVAAWLAALDARGRGVYLRFQALDATHGLLTAAVLGLAIASLARKLRVPEAPLRAAPATLAASELIENGCLAAAAVSSRAAFLVPVAAALRLTKFAAGGISVATILVLLAANGLNWLRRPARPKEGR